MASKQVQVEGRRNFVNLPMTKSKNKSSLILSLKIVFTSYRYQKFAISRWSDSDECGFTNSLHG